MTTSRIVLFGATGFTGRLTAEALVRRGARPLLVGRDQGRLDALAAGLYGAPGGGTPGGGAPEGAPEAVPPTAVGDASRPASLRRIVQPGDVLVTTVGPFLRLGEAAVAAAVEAGAVYLDSAGEPAFIKRIFQRYGPAAAARGGALLTAFGYDCVPGNLAAALALAKAGPAAARVDVGYFVRGRMARRLSAGTRASAIGAVLEPSYGFRQGRIVRDRTRTRLFLVGGRRRRGLSMGASEHFTLPPVHPGLREINVYFGWLGPLTRPAAVVARAAPLIAAVPGARRAADALADRVIRTGRGGATAGPGVRSRIVAEVYDENGRPLAVVELEGGDPYDFTARLLAWAATTALTRGVRGTGALGPVDAFGLEALVEGCAEAGLVTRERH
ncbi:saccharopine dehydrogenase NADP-binding domain-containing protein [Microbispora sp. RL4-1S]|uniref:Saccharopine dehydrogenase NADP-binding domain-containing protein n=1 Tax=Microbispora oryzae TaxID=2806554 RepID=A0A941AHP2_9ACTN|nr:saccharopine dehydrogenase NADP-binding domain-containing protein [Microbispora oryzae]MBP2704306.1 saccharopine dehydrogenase NADP-binding domain-containing protein [Microbispora oryzae]